MRCFILVTLLLLYSSSVHAAGLPKSILDKVPGMNSAQLYALQTVRIGNAIEMEAEHRSIRVREHHRDPLYACIKNMLRAAFSPEDIRTMLLEPPGIDYAYYDKRITIVMNNISKKCLPILDR